MRPITIYHNPKCGTSRNTLAMIRQTGIEPTIIEYLQTPPSRETLLELIRQMNIPVRDVIRSKEKIYKELKLNNPASTDEEMIAAMLAHPILINRPIVVTDLGTRLCRPSEIVLEILPLPLPSPFIKEDGEIVLDKRQR